ncbi:MAG TPA: HAD family hydrolase [Patescibacteria group bacterium]|nr:HAD family hydrolase [Patescibacteria group bacterium]
MIKCVVFDVDGTLIDTGEAIISSLQKVLKENSGQAYSDDELSFAFGIPGAVTLAKLGVSDIEASLEKWIKYLNDFSDTMKIFDGIESCLKKIKELNIKTGIVTSKTKEEFDSNFIPFGLESYFDYVICADDTDKHKPHPEPILKLMEMCGDDPKDLVYIGDTKYDKECAEGAGVRFGLALWGAKSTDGFDSSYILHSPNDILELITSV